jgi:hypothetical protein
MRPDLGPVIRGWDWSIAPSQHEFAVLDIVMQSLANHLSMDADPPSHKSRRRLYRFNINSGDHIRFNPHYLHIGDTFDRIRSVKHSNIKKPTQEAGCPEELSQTDLYNGQFVHSTGRRQLPELCPYAGRFSGLN